MKVFWTDTAVKHLSGIYAYIAQNSPQYARRMVDRLTRRSEQISKFPASGRIVPEFEAEQIREGLRVLIGLFTTLNPIKSTYLL